MSMGALLFSECEIEMIVYLNLFGLLKWMGYSSSLVLEVGGDAVTILFFFFFLLIMDHGAQALCSAASFPSIVYEV